MINFYITDMANPDVLHMSIDLSIRLIVPLIVLLHVNNPIYIKSATQHTLSNIE